MKKYRTKSGKVEEKLPGINATVSPSEKVQIAMAGGADTLKDVQTILGQQGKRNNLKGQGAKHIVSFQYEGGYGGQDDESDEAVGNASDVNQGAVDAAEGIAAGKPGPGMFGGYSGGGGFQDPSGGPSGGPNDGLYRSDKARDTAKRALLDISKNPNIKGMTQEDINTGVKRDRARAAWLQGDTELNYDLRAYYNKNPNASPLSKEQYNYARQSLEMAKEDVKEHEDSLLSIGDKDIRSKFSSDKFVYEGSIDYKNVVIRGALALASAGATVAALPAVSAVADAGSLALGVSKLTNKGNNAPDRYQPYDTRTNVDYRTPKEVTESYRGALPPPPVDESGGDTPKKKKKKKPISYTDNKVTLDVTGPTRAQKRYRGGWRAA